MRLMKGTGRSLGSSLRHRPLTWEVAIVVVVLALVLGVVLLLRSHDTATLLPAPSSSSSLQGTEADAKRAVAQLSGNLIAMNEVDAGVVRHAHLSGVRR
jgi:hypothetical protein